MAESLSSTLSSAVQIIGKLVIEEVKFLQGVSERVRLLHDDLKGIQRFLRYADTKQTARDSIQQWVPEFRAVAYEAIDLVEDYVLRVSISSNGGCCTLKRIACMATEGYARHNLGVEIQSLRNRISNLTKNFGEYGHVMTRTEEGESSAPSRLQQLRRTRSSVADKDVVELPDDVQVLVKYLLNEVAEHKISVASIFGMGGIGKTTLARKVYHHGRLKDYFEGFAWVCVSQQWQPNDLLQGILLKLTPEQSNQIMTSKQDGLERLLQHHLQDNKCLIVLDDLWSTEAWDCLKDVIPVSEDGSKILLTTRNEDVAAYVGPNGYHHKLRCLTEEESWELLRKKSLWESNGAGCEDLGKMEELGKKMLNNCRGLPLALVVLGGILRTKKTLKEWKEVHENIKSYLARGEKIGKEGEVPKILAYSYYDLPWQLKPCFLYLGKFREDSDIRAESLYQMWMGEGMIFENDRREQETMMDVAERYLKELAIRCMVEIKAYEEGKHAVTKLESCRLHDLMRDLCLDKAKEENLYKLVDRSPSQDSPPTTEAQFGLVLRLLPEDISQYKFPPKEQTKHLCSFLCDPLAGKGQLPIPGVRIMSQVKNLKMLRVLAMLSFNMASQSCYLKSPLGYVSKLIHLRCLRLRGQSINLPYSLGNLKYLETLDLSGSDNSCRIPNVLWKLERFRYLYLPNWWLGPQHKWGPQPKLQLSKQLEILESFDNRFCYPKDVCKLSNLRSFKANVYKNLEDLERIINHISNLDCLRISSLIIRSCNFGKTNSNNSNDSNGSLDVLSRVLFSRNIHELEIRNSLCKKLPDYQSQTVPHPAGLTQLSLSYSGIEEDPMATLEKLPKLRILELGPKSFLGQEMSCHSMGFPQLKDLVLFGLGNLMQWKVDEGAMPKLSGLRIEVCTTLEMIPDGLRCLTTLEEVSLAGMPEEFNNRVRIENGQQGEDYDKISHVPSVKIYRRVKGVIGYQVETVCPSNPV
ncbi:putative disease resistance protein At1g50180 isoform X1 [Coffea arabica]|uniref:Disease resistance protein At1g50180 isoform X1 n=1 Tax=Coffea arabica TaxID=13443 RepID=A0A6P6VCJ1_COFAR|nr:putative disease resistance protein At1g50180 isoform X1 [Coffea arabica]XP_027100678.1 putative disease resistance protein At1g50180 isoform X1 [Coffea arabica]